MKKKLTLSVREDLLEEAKLYAYEVKRSLSEIVEEYLEYLASTRWIDGSAKKLNLGELEPTSEFEIPMSRPKGLDAAKTVRELRDARARASVSGAE